MCSAQRLVVQTKTNLQNKSISNCAYTSYLALLLEKRHAKIVQVVFQVFDFVFCFILFYLLRKKYVLNFLFLLCLRSHYYNCCSNKFRTRTNSRVQCIYSSITKLLTVTCQSFQLTAFSFIGWKYTKKSERTHTQSTQIVFIK